MTRTTEERLDDGKAAQASIEPAPPAPPSPPPMPTTTTRLIYAVDKKVNGGPLIETTLVFAKGGRSAIAHCTADTYTARRPKPEEVARRLADGAVIQTAKG